MTNKNNWAKYGIHSINHVAVEIPDLEIEQQFLDEFGLRVSSSEGVLKVRASAHDHVWVRIAEGKQKKLAYVSVGCYQSDFDGLVEQILDNGGQKAAKHPIGDDDGFWFTDPHGMLLQLRVAGKTMPDAKQAIPDMNVPEGVQGATNRRDMAKVYPTRLAHILLFTPSVNQSVEFYEKGLGVKTADRTGDGVAFTYARFGCDHHLLAFVTSNAVGIHHLSWDVEGIDDLGLGAERMRSAGYVRQWGMGRHVLGSNYFNYICDNFGLWWEYSCHIDYIPEGALWDGGDHDPENAFYLWGPEVPKGFAENSET
jgi:catechol 2,3-dioxygenase-like lactoylglutathione lyase family enzyme